LNEIIKINQATKVYPTRQGPLHALGPVDLSVNQGEFVSIVGPSGCGKSTLMLMIAGLQDITSGEIYVEDQKVVSPQTDIGIVFQTPVLVDWNSVLGNVMLQIEMRKLNPELYIDRAKSLLKSVGLSDFECCFPYELSGGMQQRTAFCRALVHDPSLVLMDEPLGALDAMTRDQLRVDLEQLWMQTRKTVIFVTHSIAESVQLSDRVVIFSPRPGMIDRIIEIDLPRPRSMDVRESKKFQKYVREITDIFMNYGILREGSPSAVSQ
jgi:NitT/TauT family transport system ATP-binding protein